MFPPPPPQLWCPSLCQYCKHPVCGQIIIVVSFLTLLANTFDIMLCVLTGFYSQPLHYKSDCTLAVCAVWLILCYMFWPKWNRPDPCVCSYKLQVSRPFLSLSLCFSFSTAKKKIHGLNFIFFCCVKVCLSALNDGISWKYTVFCIVLGSLCSIFFHL
jgi:hypothetical protein